MRATHAVSEQPMGRDAVRRGVQAPGGLFTARLLLLVDASKDSFGTDDSLGPAQNHGHALRSHLRAQEARERAARDRGHPQIGEHRRRGSASAKLAPSVGSRSKCR